MSKMPKRYKLLLVAVIAVGMLRICLSNNTKNEKDILPVTGAAVAVRVTPDISVPAPVNRDIFGINIGFALKRELDKDSGFVQLLRDLHPASLRFPGGTVANYYHPQLPVYGYKIGEIPPSLGGLYMEQSKRSENILFNFIRLCKLTGAKAVFCANVLNGTPEETLFVIDQLKKNNIPILGVELGNEFCLMEYRKQFPDANAYIRKISSTVAAIQKAYPDIRLVVIAGDGVPPKEMNARSKFMRAWNTVLAKQHFYHAYAWHPYQDCPGCDKEEYFDNLYVKNVNALAPQRTNFLYQLGMNLASIYGPERKLWLTEWNIGNLNYLDNTMMQGLYVSEYFQTIIGLNARFNNYIEVTNLHSIEGLITPQKGKLQPLLVKGIDVASVQYFAFKFLSSTIDGNTFKARESVECADTSVSKNFVCFTYVHKKENKTYVHFVNRSGKRVELAVHAKPKAAMELHAIESDYPYATAGKTYYEKTYPGKLKPVRYREEALSANAVSIAPYAFGYISYGN
jgi:hypothetical protein